MPTDLPARDAAIHPAVAALLGARDKPFNAAKLRSPRSWVREAAQIPVNEAARQAAAVLRCAAETMPHMWTQPDALKWLRDQADEIDPQEGDAEACPDCGLPNHDTPTRRDERHDHCGPLPHTGPIGGPYCEKCG